jgi:hypothetical integral membrane protein (TIGR02206 family)
MRPYIRLFGPEHFVILVTVPALAAFLAIVQRKFFAGSQRLRLILAALLLLDTVVFYWYQVTHGLLSFPGHLPLELCDVSLVLVCVSLLLLDETVFDLAYYLSLGGATMALLTPNLWEPFPSFGTVQFFVAHGLTVAGVLYLVWSGLARPRPRSIGRAMLGLNVFAVVVGGFDYFFKTNYMYLRAKPPNASLLDFLGPWPWYIVSAEVSALAIFALLYLPFRRRTEKTA